MSAHPDAVALAVEHAASTGVETGSALAVHRESPAHPLVVRVEDAASRRRRPSPGTGLASLVTVRVVRVALGEDRGGSWRVVGTREATRGATNELYGAALDSLARGPLPAAGRGLASRLLAHDASDERSGRDLGYLLVGEELTPSRLRAVIVLLDEVATGVPLEWALRRRREGTS